MKQLTEKEVLRKLTATCARREHCIFEMREKMKQWQVDEDTQQRAIDYLTEHQFIDEERFCRAFVKDKLTYNKWGRKKVEQALFAKRLSGDLIERVLDEVEPENYEATLRPLLETKRKSIKADSDYERNAKLIRFALSRGFTMDTILKVLNTDS